MTSHNHFTGGDRLFQFLPLGVTAIVVAFLLALPGAASAANLARTGVASQSSDYSTAAVASKAIDGNRDGNWASGSVTHTIEPGADNEWWVVDLGSVCSVDTVTLWNRTDCCGERMSNLRISLLDGSSNEVYRTDIPNSNPVAAGGARGFPMPYGSVGRYVRVQSLPGNNAAGNNIIALAEVEVWGVANPALANLTRNQGCLLTSSSVTSGGTPDRAGDGNVDPIFSDGSMMHTDPAVTTGTWLEADMGSRAAINQIWLFNRSDCCGTRLGNFRISVFDGANEVYGTNCMTGGASVAQGQAFNVNFPTPQPGSRVRVSLINNTNSAGDSVLSVAEMQVFGTAGPDVFPPKLTSVQTASTNTVIVRFSEPLALASATNLANYSISSSNGLLAILSATLNATSNQVTLLTGPISLDVLYSLVVNGVTDRSGNTIAANSGLTFLVPRFCPPNIGGGLVTGAVVQVAGGLDMVAAGSGTSGYSDQFFFNGEIQFGDFDVSVRIDSISLANPNARAGLMARAGATANALFAAVWATPSINGCFLESRASLGAASTLAGAFAVNYPYTWLRLQRVGDLFRGYGSYDGVNWRLVASESIVMVDPLYLGVAGFSGSTSQPITASFRDIKDATGAGLGTGVVPVIESPGPSSRRTGLTFTEIMYNPQPLPGVNNRLEFVELFNSQTIPEDIGGYRLSGDIEFAFPSGTILPAGGIVVIAKHPDAVMAYYGITGVMGPYTNSLPDGSGLLRLRNHLDAILLEVQYDQRNPWPPAAGGVGHSLVLARPSYGEGNVMAWATSDRIGGSPGRLDSFSIDPQRAVVINEILANTNGVLSDYIELYNHGNIPVDVSGCLLSTDASNLNIESTTNVFRIPLATVVPARGLITFERSQLGFGLNAGGECVYFVNSNHTCVLDAVFYPSEAAGVSVGRFPDGAGEFRSLNHPTPGTNNAAPLLRDIVINEIMYAPISGNKDDQFIELYNKGSQTVSMAGWRFTAGIDYTFQAGVTIAPGAYLVIARNTTNLLARYPGTLSSANTLGDYSGSLAGGGERVALSMPESTVKITSLGVMETNTFWVVESEVIYETGGRWGTWSDGGGSSLELVDSHADPRQSSNWSDSDETAKSSWASFSYTATFSESLYSVINDNVHVYLGDLGECLVDDVDVLNSAGQSVMKGYGSFDGAVGLTNVDLALLNANGGNLPAAYTNYWLMQGAYDQSSIDPNGYNGTPCLHIRGGAHGDPGPNKIRSPLFSQLVANSATLKLKARWLRGWPELLMRVHGGTIDSPFRMPVPTNLGTPGARNSRTIANAGPAIAQVGHQPVMPAANEAVVVTAQSWDPDGLASLHLMYRIDPDNTFTTLNMVDDGTVGDAVAGDGIFSATIPPQAAGKVAAFYIEAVDQAGATNLFPRDVFPSPGLASAFPVDSPTRECVVRFGDAQMSGGFATYHLWMTASTLNRWNNREPRSNAGMDVTFVYNNYRAVYNSLAKSSGSAFHRGQQTTGPSGRLRCDYDITLPTDDEVLGSDAVSLDLPGNTSDVNGTDASALCEQLSMLLFKKMGMNYNHRRYVHVFVNGSQRSSIANLSGNYVLEDTQRPGRDYVKQWWPNDSGGELVKEDDWFEFNDQASDFANNDGDFQRRMITVAGSNTLAMARYRFMWQHRAVAAGQSAFNFSSFPDLINIISPTTDDAAPINYPAFNAVADVEQWMREFACQRIVGNFDSYGYTRGKNNSIYKPTQGRVQFIPFDVDWSFGTGIGAGYNAGLFDYSDPRANAMYNQPDIRRLYLRALKELADNYFNAAFLYPEIDARLSAFSANNVSYDPGTVSTVRNYIVLRHDYIYSQLAGLTNAFAFGSTNYIVSSNGVVTLSGKAPVDVESIQVNGVSYPVTWGADYVTWTLKLYLMRGTNAVVITPALRGGIPLSAYSQALTVNVVAPLALPEGNVVFNEIMYNPVVPNASYVELFNRSTNTTFDLTGWRVNGIGYQFPGGALLGPGGVLLLVQDRDAFALAYGSNSNVFDVFTGNLQNSGETLALLRPVAGVETVVDLVRYDSEVPWPSQANGKGASLQLVDPRQDHRRALNWTDGAGWRFFSFTGVGGGSAKTLRIYPDTTGELYIDDLMWVTGAVATVGSNYIRDGGFEGPLMTNQGGAWGFNGSTLATNYSEIVTNAAHSGKSSLKIRFNKASAAIYLQTDLAAPSGTNTLSFWYLPSTNVNTLSLYNQSSFRPVASVKPIIPTPGITNAVSQILPAMPPVWLNEVAPHGVAGVLDNSGEADPWVEIYNAGTNILDLGGLYLSDEYTNLSKWTIPAGTVVQPGGFSVIWLDGQPEQTSGTNIHGGFRLGGTNGSIALSMNVNGSPGVLDYFNWKNVGSNHSYGAYPDGDPYARQHFDYPTLGITNNPSTAPIVVWINEWMADNVNRVAQPGTNFFADWFELYNPGDEAIDLGGCYLSDSYLQWNQFRVPNGNVIPARGYLVVWADKQTSLNTGSNGLHVPFALSRTGELIGLFNKDGIVVDVVQFSTQGPNVSSGRYPDGSAILMDLAQPTPGAPNTASIGVLNTAPLLGSLPPRMLVLGQSLSQTVPAFDSDIPAQTLSFGLVNPPAGATINAASGLLQWTPALSDLGSNALSVTVWDNGVPPMSATNVLMVVVGPRPNVDQGGVVVNGAEVRLTFNALPGKSYRIEYQDALDPNGVWQVLGANRTATGTTLTVTDAPHASRFYRIATAD